MSKFQDAVCELEKIDEDSALDLIMETFLFSDVPIKDQDQIFAKLDVERLSEYLIVGFLSASFLNRQKLKHRKVFYEKAHQKFSREYDDKAVNDILWGLDAD